MNQITIRKATSNDLGILQTFEQDLITTERPFDSTLAKAPIHYYDLKGMIGASNVELVVAELNHKIIGSGYARIETSKPYLEHKNHAYLGFMYVLPEHRGKGINMKIIESLKNWAASKKIMEIRLDVYVNNFSAIKAYEKIGFKSHMVEMRFNISGSQI